MRSVKDAGPGEVDRLRRRIGSALGRQTIEQDDHDFIRVRLDEIDGRIQDMKEEEDGKA
jgi:hypothetical protein